MEIQASSLNTRPKAFSALNRVPFFTIEDIPIQRKNVLIESKNLGFSSKGYASSTKNFINSVKNVLIKGKECVVLLDIDLGKNKSTEGVIIASVLRDLEDECGFENNRKIYIIFYSAQLPFHNQEELLRAGANKNVDKTGDYETDICHIASQFIYHSNHQNNLSNYKDMERLLPAISEQNQIKYQSRLNRMKLKSLLSDTGWREKHRGKYIALLGGEIIGEEDNLSLLLDNIPEDDGVLLEKIGEETIPDNINFMSPFSIRMVD